MTKAEIIGQIAEDAEITKDKAKKTLDSLIGAIQNELVDGEGKFTLTGFGTFSKVHLNERQGTNPATGEKITVKARNAIRFKPGKTLKSAVAPV